MLGTIILITTNFFNVYCGSESGYYNYIYNYNPNNNQSRIHFFCGSETGLDSGAHSSSSGTCFYEPSRRPVGLGVCFKWPAARALSGA